VSITSETATANRSGSENPDRERDAGRAPATPPAQAEQPDLVVEDLLVEDVSIDGMCGVY
jgi:mycofactocin precursor